MNTNSIISVDHSLIDCIYAHLDNSPKTRFGFRVACKVFYQIAIENKKWEGLAAFILKHYQIVASHPASYPLWLLLKTHSVLGLGEKHNIDQHRKFNARVIHAIWKEGTHVLLTESKQRPNSCQITYVKSSIGEHS